MNKYALNIILDKFEQHALDTREFRHKIISISSCFEKLSTNHMSVLKELTVRILERTNSKRILYGSTLI